MFNNFYKNKKVLITGHTGFKGSWLTQWLLNLGSSVIGISKDIPSRPSMYEILDLKRDMKSIFFDIVETEKLLEVILKEKPQVIFHLAAQPIVSESYSNPLGTISDNVLGTASLLDCFSKISWKCTSVIITSDKCYRNVEKKAGYIEDDIIGGKDIYSGSKGAAELIIKSYFDSFIESKKNLSLSIARAGNVIGGGDWAKDRLIVDCIKSWIKKTPVHIRNTNSTRPWQHVLEPLSGYLQLAEENFTNKIFNGEPFNFGPEMNETKKVIELIEDLYSKWKKFEQFDFFRQSRSNDFYEAGLLQLDISKAKKDLNWNPTLKYEEMISFISSWYISFYKDNEKISELTKNQILEFENLAKQRGIKWAQS